MDPVIGRQFAATPRVLTTVGAILVIMVTDFHVLIEMSAQRKTTDVTRKQGVSTMRGHINAFVKKDITETAGSVKVSKTFQFILPLGIIASFLY